MNPLGATDKTPLASLRRLAVKPAPLAVARLGSSVMSVAPGN